jgi:hypothetical protein
MSNKFIEELNYGDAFSYNNLCYVLTTDYKKNNDRLCLSLIDGGLRWFKPNEIVEGTNLYTMDKDNNIIAIKESKKEDVANQTQNIP